MNHKDHEDHKGKPFFFVVFVIFVVLLFVRSSWFVRPPTRRPADRSRESGQPAVVRALLAQRADANAREVDGTTALHWAVRSDDRATVAALLKAGADVSATNRYGVTPLSLAATNGNAAIVDALLDAGRRREQRVARGRDGADDRGADGRAARWSRRCSTTAPT